MSNRMFAACAVWLLTGSIAFAQAVSTASIGGRVTDESGGALPGATVTATQTGTGAVRTATTDGEGGYTISNLPIGPYRVEFTLPGFRTYVQTGIVLQVSSNPTINATLGLGALTESVQVEASAPLVETRSPGIGQVVDNQRVMELPLNGRQTLDLVFLAAPAAPSGTLAGARGTTVGVTATISIAGGLANGTSYILDGGTHNDPFNNAAFPLPFPEALQEFRVETSALPAQYGHHSAAAVNAVTKAGTNQFRGSGFEFFRDDALNAKDPFAPIGADGERRGDGLNRHQFGGVLGGPIARDRLFFFGGYQRTRIRQSPTSSFQFVPTPAMRAGDFSAIASPACNAGRSIQLRAPFVDNRVSPALFSPASLALIERLPVPDNPCGQVFFDRKEDSDEHAFIGRVDYQATGNHSLFGRLQVTKLDTPGNYDGRTLMSFSQAAFHNRIYALVLGDTLVLGSDTVNSVRVTVNRGDFGKTHIPLVDFADLGIKATPVVDGVLRMSVSGGFSLTPPTAVPGTTPTWTYQVADDLSMVRGQHQFGLGVNYIYNEYGATTFLPASGNVTFTGQATGLGLADFMLGRANTFSQGSLASLDLRQHYIALYAQDSWRLSPNVTVNAGLRWEPYLPALSDNALHFDRDRFRRGVRSTVFVQAPPGLMFPGDDGFPGDKVARNDTWNFAPRAGIVWDPQGAGRESLRAAYGRFYDVPHFTAYGALQQIAPWGNTITLNNLPRGWDDPWAAFPGGDPIPIQTSHDMEFPRFASYVTFPFDLPATSMDQWNASYQRQFGTSVMASANYVGSFTRNVWTGNEINPAVFEPGASVANTNQRRALFRENADAGSYFASVQELDPTGTADYHALMLTLQRRSAGGLSIQGNYTASRCFTDLQNYSLGLSFQPYMIPGDRDADRGRCANAPQHQLNVSTVYRIPAAGDQALVRAVTSDWQVSTILRAQSGSFFTVTTGVDTALTAQPAQRANQVLDDPFLPDRSFAGWLNPAAFAVPATGTYGTMRLDALKGPGRWNLDLAVTRTIGVAAERQVQLRLEVFNVFNHVNPANPVASLSRPDFGRITAAAGEPRILQLGVKYQF